MEALGMIEVYGYLAAVEALDSALKAAGISLIEVTKVTGGLVSVMVSGEVGAIKAATCAAAVAAARVGEVVSVHVIARPADEIDKIVGTKNIEKLPDEIRQSPAADDMDKMTVANLRKVARELQLPNMTKQEIRFAKKQELINEIMKHLKGE